MFTEGTYRRWLQAVVVTVRWVQSGGYSPVVTVRWFHLECGLESGAEYDAVVVVTGGGGYSPVVTGEVWRWFHLECGLESGAEHDADQRRHLPCKRGSGLKGGAVLRGAGPRPVALWGLRVSAQLP